MMDDWVELPPLKVAPSVKRIVTRALREIDSGTFARGRFCNFIQGKNSFEYNLAKAAVLIVSDLHTQGWRLRFVGKRIYLSFPREGSDAEHERERVRQQELIKRNEQLSKSSVLRFLERMENVRTFNGRFVSIFSLMKDGRDLSKRIEAVGEDVTSLVDPYIEFVDSKSTCIHTGFRLMDVWRYFRLTWVNQYQSVPGRSLMALVRDKSSDFHPIVGIFALSSPVVQLQTRDEWIGWRSKELTSWMLEGDSARKFNWFEETLDQSIKSVRTADFIEEGLLSYEKLKNPSPELISILRDRSKTEKEKHYRFTNRQEFSNTKEQNALGRKWLRRSETHLFRSKRMLLLAEMLEVRLSLNAIDRQRGLKVACNEFLATSSGRKAFDALVRRVRAEKVGICIADISVCGAIAPYNELMGGKLVSVLASSPETVLKYKEKYANSTSEIASSMAGKAIVRKPELVLLGTTSLYGASSVQYNRLNVPCEVAGGKAGHFVRFKRLGKTESFGTSQFSESTLQSLVDVLQQSKRGIRVNSIFGEGVSPKLRKVREGIDLIGYPSDALLKHGRRRIVYGVSLIHNLREYLIGYSSKPKYTFSLRDPKKSRLALSQWWFDRWASKRISSSETHNKLKTQHLDYPIVHGARVRRSQKTADIDHYQTGKTLAEF